MKKSCHSKKHLLLMFPKKHPMKPYGEKHRSGQESEREQGDAPVKAFRVSQERAGLSGKILG